MAVSPVVVAGLGCAAVAAGLALGITSLVRAVGDAIAAACSARVEFELGAALPHSHQVLQSGELALAVLRLATPLVGVAIIAIFGHLAQTRTLWLPRRRIAGAPAVERGIASRSRAAAFELLCAATIGSVAFGFLWLEAPRIAGLVELTAPDMLRSVTALVAAFLSCVAIAWLVLGVADALARHIGLAHAVAMTAAEKREDDRLAAADPKWAKQRAALSRAPTVEPAVRTAAVIVLGDDLSVAIAWDPLNQPIPTRVAAGRGARATQLVGLARRHSIAVHRDPTLASILGHTLGPVPDREWARLAEIIAAVRR